MKKLSALLLTVIAATVLLATTSTEDSVLLRLNLSEGSSYNIHTNTVQDINTQVGGRDITSHMNAKETIKLEVVKQYKQDSLLLNASFQHIAFKASAMGNEISFDSDSSEGSSENKFSDFYHKLQKKLLTIKITPLGEILDIQGLDHIIEAEKNSISNPALTKMFNQLLSKQNLKNGFFNVGMYPKKPVSEGSQWNIDRAINGQVPMALHLIYTVKDIQSDKVLLDVEGRLSSTKDSITVRGMRLPVKATGTQRGSYTINRSTGLVSSGNLEQDINVTMSLMGRSVNVETKGKINIFTESGE